MPRYPAAPPQKSSAEAGGVAAVDRALMLLAAFREGDRSLSLIELAGRTQRVKSTALRLLASLIHFGLVQRLDDGRYALGPEVARLQSIYTASFSLEAVVMPVLRGLVDRTRESAAFHVRQGELRLCLYRVDSPQPIRYHVQVLGFGGEGSRDAVRVLADQLGRQQRDLRSMAITALERLGPVARDAVPALEYHRDHLRAGDIERSITEQALEAIASGPR